MAVQYGIAVRVESSTNYLAGVSNWSSIRPLYLMTTNSSSAVSLSTSGWQNQLLVVTTNGFTAKYALYPIDTSLWSPGTSYNVNDWVHNNSSNPELPLTENVTCDIYVYDHDSPINSTIGGYGSIPYFRFQPYFEFWRYSNSTASVREIYSKSTSILKADELFAPYGTFGNTSSHGVVITRMSITRKSGNTGTINGGVKVTATAAGSLTVNSTPYPAYDVNAKSFTSAQLSMPSTAGTTNSGVFVIHNPMTSSSLQLNMALTLTNSVSNKISQATWNISDSTYQGPNQWVSQTIGYSTIHAITVTSASNGKLLQQSFSVTAGKRYTFYIHLQSPTTYCGVVIASASQTYKSSIASYTGSSVLHTKAGGGFGTVVLDSFSYSPTANGSVYIGFSQNSGFAYSSSANIADVEVVEEQISSYDKPTVTGYTYDNYPASGVTKNPTVTYSQTAHWTDGATTTITSGGTLAFTAGTLPSGCTKGTGTTYVFATKGGIKWASRSTTIGNSRNAASVLSVTVTMNGKTSAAFTCTSCKQNGNYVTGVTAKASSGNTHFHYNNIGAGDTSATPQLHGIYDTFTFSSGSTSITAPGSTYGTVSYSRAYTLASSQNGFTAVNASTGVLTATARGTTIGNARTSATVTSVLTVTFTHSSTYSTGGTVKSAGLSHTGTCTQNGNYVTGVTAKASSGNTHFHYNNISAGATSASPSLHGIYDTFTFSSGSTSTTAPGSTYGTVSYSRTYTLASSQNGFTAVNATNGTLTATNRAKTTGAARTSATVTSVLTVTWVHSSSYSAGGTVFGTMTSTGTCTQAANSLTWGNVSLTVSSPATPYTMNVIGEGVVINASAATQTGTYSSGSTDTYTPTLSYAVKTAKSGYSLSSNVVTVTNNKSTSARNGFVVTVKAEGKKGTDSTYITGYNKTATSDRTFNQPAGTVVYDTPEVTEYKYPYFSAAGQTRTPSSVTYQQTATWNGTETVTITTGGTLAYTTSGTLPSYFSVTSSFPTNGQCTFASRGTTIGTSRDAKSYLYVTVTMNGKTSAAFQCTLCTQYANYVTAVAARATSGSSHFSYANIGAGATSASPTLTGGATFTFTSGSTTNTEPGSSGTTTYTRTYSWTGTQNGFTAINASTGVLTATNRAKTTGAARTSATVTSNLVVTFTHSSTYTNGGTVTSDPMTSTATCTQNANILTWGNVTFTSSTTPATPYAMNKAGETVTISPKATQTGTYSSGSTDTFTPTTFSYAVTTAKDGYTLINTNQVKVTNNTTTSARNGFVVTVTATGKTGTNTDYITGFGKTGTSARTFNQPAGAKVYSTPEITGYAYGNYVASGVTGKAPTTITYEQDWTWNGVAGSGGTLTSGGTLAYTTTGTFPTGFSIASDFATSGKINWASRGTTIGNSLDAKNNLRVTVTMNSKTSAAFTCTSCKQNGNYVTGVTAKASSGNTHFHYNNISAGATSASPSLHGIYDTFTFSSGSTSTTAPGSTYGTVSYSRTYTLASSQNEFTAVNATNGTLTATARGTTIGSSRYSAYVTGVLTVTFTHSDTYSAGGTVNSAGLSHTARCLQLANYLTGITVPNSFFSYANINAGATSASPTFSAPTFTFSSGSTSTTAPGSSYGTTTYSRSFTLASSQYGFTAVNATTGVLTATARGTTLGNSRYSAYVTGTETVTFTHASSYSAGDTVTSNEASSTARCLQLGNYVVSLVASGSYGSNNAHFHYEDITAGATSATRTTNGKCTYTFSSGSTIVDSTSTPSFGGSATYSRTYTLANTTPNNGFTAVNATNGTLTATNREKTTGAARTSPVVTSVLTITYTHPSAFSTGGTVESNSYSSTATCTQAANYLVWAAPTASMISPSTPYAMSNAGETKAITVSTQTGTYSSGSTDTYTPTITSTVKTSKTGYSLSSNSVTVTNNKSTSARNGFVVTVTLAGKTGTNTDYISGLNQTVSSDRTFNQAAGAKVYGTPTINTYNYTSTSPTGVSGKSPNSITYSMPYTWNGVSADSGTDTTGGTLTYTTTGTLPSGFSVASDFATSGKINWTNNTSTSAKDAKSNLHVTVTTPTGNKTSTPAFQCTNCPQQAGIIDYGTPTLSGSYTYATAAASGVTDASPSATPSYSQVWTWNGVSGSGGTITTGGTYGYSTTGTLPSGFSTGTDFATTGKINWASRETTIGNSLDAKSNLKVTVTMNGKTSSALTCTNCTQEANNVETLTLTLGSSSIVYGTSTTGTVNATFSSGAQGDVTSLATLTAEKDSGNNDLVQIT